VSPLVEKKVENTPAVSTYHSLFCILSASDRRKNAWWPQNTPPSSVHKASRHHVSWHSISAAEVTDGRGYNARYQSSITSW